MSKWYLCLIAGFFLIAGLFGETPAGQWCGTVGRTVGSNLNILHI